MHSNTYAKHLHIALAPPQSLSPRHPNVKISEQNVFKEGPHSRTLLMEFVPNGKSIVKPLSNFRVTRNFPFSNWAKNLFSRDLVVFGSSLSTHKKEILLVRIPFCFCFLCIPSLHHPSFSAHSRSPLLSVLFFFLAPLASLSEGFPSEYNRILTL